MPVKRFLDDLTGTENGIAGSFLVSQKVTGLERTTPTSSLPTCSGANK